MKKENVFINFLFGCLVFSIILLISMLVGSVIAEIFEVSYRIGAWLFASLISTLCILHIIELLESKEK